MLPWTFQKLRSFLNKRENDKFVSISLFLYKNWQCVCFCCIQSYFFYHLTSLTTTFRKMIHRHTTMASPERWKIYAHQRETTGSSSDSPQLRPFTQWELLLKERICSQRERIRERILFFYKSSSLCSSLCYGKSLKYHIRWSSLNDAILVRTCWLRNGGYANV